MSGPAAWSTCRRCASCMDASRAAAALARRDDSGPSSAIHGLLPCGGVTAAASERAPDPSRRSRRRSGDDRVRKLDQKGGIQQEQRPSSERSGRLSWRGRSGPRGNRAGDCKHTGSIEARTEARGPAGARPDTNECVTRYLIRIRVMIRRVVTRCVVARLVDVREGLGQHRQLAGVAEQEEHRQHEDERSRCRPPPAKTRHRAQLTGRRISVKLASRHIAQRASRGGGSRVHTGRRPEAMLARERHQEDLGDILAREPLEALARPAASVRRLTDRKCQDALQRVLLWLGVGEAGLSSAPSSASGATVRA